MEEGGGAFGYCLSRSFALFTFSMYLFRTFIIWTKKTQNNVHFSKRICTNLEMLLYNVMLSIVLHRVLCYIYLLKLSMGLFYLPIAILPKVYYKDSLAMLVSSNLDPLC